MRLNAAVLQLNAVKGGWLPAAAITALIVVSGLPLLDRGIVTLDEGQVAAFAVRILHGDVLYRDMYSGIFPGIYYLTAGLFSVFGTDLLVTRFAQLAVNLFTALCLWRLATRALSPLWSLLPPVLYALLVVWSFPVMTMFAYSAVSLLFALAALLLAFRYTESGRVFDGMAAGALLAACALAKQNYGFLAGVAVLYTLLDACRVDRLKGRRIVAMLVPVVSVGGLVTLVTLGAIVIAGAWPRFWQYTAQTITSSQLQAFDQPIPPIFGAHPSDDGRFVFLYTPGLLFNYLIRGERLMGITISPLLRSALIRISYGGVLTLLISSPFILFGTRAQASEPQRSAARRLWIAASMMFLGMFPSAIWSHLTAVLPPVLLLGAVVAARLHDVLRAKSARAAHVACIAGATVLGLCTLLSVRVVMDFRRWNDTPLRLERATLRVGEGDAQLLRGAVSYLEHCARPGEPILVLPDMPLVYFLTDRPNPTPYEMTIPGDVDSTMLIDRVEGAGTRCAVYNPKMYVHFDPLEKVFPIIADYVATRFEKAEDINGGGRTWYGLVHRAESQS